jgi:hypothetical protein
MCLAKTEGFLDRELVPVVEICVEAPRIDLASIPQKRNVAVKQKNLLDADEDLHLSAGCAARVRPKSREASG